jgi:rhodanese-related sulfurtransferase
VTKKVEQADLEGVDPMADTLRIDAREAKRLVDAGEALVLDVVAPGVWEELDVAVPGALRIAPPEIEGRFAELPRERAVVAYCT